MIPFFRKRKTNKYIEDLRGYISSHYTPPRDICYCLPPDVNINEISKEKKDEKRILYSDRSTNKEESHAVVEPNIKYSNKRNVRLGDQYSALKVDGLLRDYSKTNDFGEAIKNLEQAVNQTFVDKLLDYIKKKDLRDSQVYKAAQVDKRLFSKIVSNRQYKPSKDTAVALSLALGLTLDEANDILSRAGYTLSHSSMRDIIIEYFFREKIYNLMDLNCVLYSYQQKLIGR